MTAPSQGGDTGQRPSEAAAPTQPPVQQAAHHGRISATWVTLALFAVVLLLLLIFILENGQRVGISYLGAHGHLPLGIALLLAAVLGILLAVIAWFGHGVQVRTKARRARKT
jgi:uncharacterized integral membrane protein